MPRHLLPVLLVLFALTSPRFIPAVSAQDTESRGLLHDIDTLKSAVRIEANELERRERDKLAIARGDVRIQMENRILTADEVEVDEAQEVLRARGKVQLIDGKSRLDGDRLEYHYRTNTGVMYQAKGAIPPATVFQGVEVHKEGDRRYRLVDGTFTTCRICQPEPGGVDWEIHAKEAVLEQDEYLEAKSASFWIRGLPALYTPYVVYPVGPRRTGWLIPGIGGGGRSGLTFKQPFFWAIDESQDLTLTGVYRGKRGPEAQASYRYILGPEASGFIDGQVMKDRRSESRDEVRAAITARHDQQFNPELSLKADINYVSDRVFRRAFPDSPPEARTASFTDSRVFLTQMWPQYGLEVRLDDSRTLNPDTNDSRLSHVPEVSFFASPQRLLGLPVLLEGHLSGTYLQRKETPDSGRADLFPTLLLPWRLMDWTTMTPSIGFRETAYTKRPGRGGGGTSRELFEARDEFTARFFRSFDVAGVGVDRLVHLLEPRLSYWYITAGNQRRIPQFDHVDYISPQNRMTYSLTNRLLTKLKEADGATRTHELLSLSLSQSVNLNPHTRTFSDLFLNALTPERIDQAVREETREPGSRAGFSRVRERRFSNLVADLRASPLQNLGLYGVTAFNTERNRVDGIEAGVRVAYPEYGRIELAHSFIRGGDTADQTSGPFVDRKSSGIIGRLLLTPMKNVAVNYYGRYDPRQDTSLENNVVLTYATCCWMVGLHFLDRSKRFVDGGNRDRETSIEFFFDLLTGGAPPPPERGAKYLRR
ncbi:MAG: LPS-assembly protein LptD [Candidatus Methylomirabilis oxyfera]|nr:LPS-assembly protein LptD [Candidatus Methylomirabilis oxyfera]